MARAGTGQVRRFNRLVTASMVTIEPVDPQARFCLSAYFDELNRRFQTGFDPAASISATADELRPPAGLFLLARLRSEPVGCGALKFHADAPTEIKRMWVADTVRGLGLGQRLLARLEHEALARGTQVVQLETNRALTEAIRLYRSRGYVEVAAFNTEPYAHHWFAKRLGPAAGLHSPAGSPATSG